MYKKQEQTNILGIKVGEISKRSGFENLYGWNILVNWIEHFVEFVKLIHPQGTKVTTFTTTSFCDWKHALDKKGFPAHEISRNHLTAITNSRKEK